MWLQSRCAGCDEPGVALCRTCRFALVAAPRVPWESAPEHGPTALADVVSAVPFTGRARRIVLGLKYRNRRQIAPHLAGLLVNRLLAAGIRPAASTRSGGERGTEVDVVTWAPTTARRRRARGFDQSELVARRVAAQLGLPCRRLLERVGDTGPQTGRDRVQRLHGPEFRARPGLDGRRVLVVDDVVTTGSTLAGAAAALRRAGADHVVRAAVAATPSGVARRRSGGPGGGSRRLVA